MRYYRQVEVDVCIRYIIYLPGTCSLLHTGRGVMFVSGI